VSTAIQQSRYSTAQGLQYIQNRNGQLDKHMEHVPPSALLHVVLIVYGNYRLRLPAAISPCGWEFGWMGHVNTSEKTGSHNPQISYTILTLCFPKCTDS